MDADRIIADIASAQHSAVSRKQLLAAGVPAHVIDHRVGRRLLLPVHAGVYRVAGTPVTWHQRIMAATLAAGPGAVASHRAAAYLHQLPGIEPRAEVSVHRARAPRPVGVIVHRLRELPTADVESRNGIPQTRPPATMIGLAAVVPVALLESALTTLSSEGWSAATSSSGASTPSATAAVPGQPRLLSCWLLGKAPSGGLRASSSAGC